MRSRGIWAPNPSPPSKTIQGMPRSQPLSHAAAARTSNRKPQYATKCGSCSACSLEASHQADTTGQPTWVHVSDIVHAGALEAVAAAQ
jgi:hypothetical protein